MSLEYDFSRQPNENKFKHLVRVSVDKLNKMHNKEWVDIKEEFNFDHSAESLRKYATGWKIMVENGYSEEISESDEEPVIKYKETTEILSNGQHKSDKLIVMSNEEEKDEKFILQAHGFNVDNWQIVSCKNSIWDSSSKDGDKTRYSSRITVKPRTEIDIKEIIKEIKKDVKPIEVEHSEVNDGGLLEIPLFDMHFGIADLEYYLPTLKKISNKITSKKWDTILFVIGQDILHTNDFKGNTANGTHIGKVNFSQAVKDAKQFYVTLIKLAIPNSVHTKVIYSNGNHDETTGYMFVQVLEATFPQVEFDSELKERKAFTWNDIFIGYTHGDKSPMNRTVKAFLSEYGKQIAMASVVEIHTGHLHSEKSNDDFGIVTRTLATKAKTDDWHYEKGFVGSRKTFQIFEYDTDSLEANYYV